MPKKMDNDPDLSESKFTPVSLVPDYRAWQIIQEQKEKLQTILADGCNPVLRRMSKEDGYRRFVRSLDDVEQYLKRNASVAIGCLDRERAHRLSTLLRDHFAMTPAEIVMVLNQMPTDESMLELIFGGKLDKEQATLVVQLIKQFLPSNVKKDTDGDGHDESTVSDKPSTVPEADTIEKAIKVENDG